MSWKDYEKHVSKLLKQKINDKNIKVISQGAEDSTKPDIIVTNIKNTKSFLFEVKMPNSQTSQFVLEVKDNKFQYGSKNRYKSNSFSRSIINYMNEHFEEYNVVAQNGINIPLPKNIIFGWIISNLKNKGVEYVFSGEKNEETIIPIEDFGKYFDAKAFFRRKKSGSRSLAQSKTNDFKESFKHLYNEDIILKENNKKCFIQTTSKINKLYIPSITYDNIIYFLSKKSSSEYEVKILSSTNNPNVIFQLSIKKDKLNSNLDLFIKLIIEKLLES